MGDTGAYWLCITLGVFLGWIFMWIATVRPLKSDLTAVLDAAEEACKMWHLMMCPDTPQSAMDADVAYTNLREVVTRVRGKP